MQYIIATAAAAYYTTLGRVKGFVNTKSYKVIGWFFQVSSSKNYKWSLFFPSGPKKNASIEESIDISFKRMPNL